MPRKLLGKTRFMMALAPEVLKRVDAICKSSYQTRTAFVESAVVRELERMERAKQK